MNKPQILGFAWEKHGKRSENSLEIWKHFSEHLLEKTQTSFRGNTGEKNSGKNEENMMVPMKTGNFRGFD